MSVLSIHPALVIWHQLIRTDDGSTPGKWDVAKMANFIKDNAPWPIDGRVLDAGGNAGGISIELQDVADECLVLELSAVSAKQFEWVKARRDCSKVRFEHGNLFDAHEYGAFDVVLMLGLFYHFRYPQLFFGLLCRIESGSICVFYSSSRQRLRPHKSSK